jgi:hypothetical protein
MKKGPGWGGTVCGRVVIAGWCRVMAGVEGMVGGRWYLLWVADNGWCWTRWEVGCGAIMGKDGLE